VDNKQKQIIKVYFKPMDIITETKVGNNILDTALKKGIHINASCGGKGICGKCRVTIEKGIVKGGLTEQISKNDTSIGVRQACLATLIEDVTIQIHIESMLDKAALKALSANSPQTAALVNKKTLKKDTNFKPALVKIVARAIPPSREDNRNDIHRLLNILHKSGENNFVFDFQTIQDLPKAWRQGNWQITTTILRPTKHLRGRNQIIRVEAGDTSTHNLAIVIDLGTTTIWGQLINLNTGEILDTEANFNNQISYGEDVISRIIYASQPGGLKRLQKIAASSINEVVENLVDHASIDLNDINLVTIAANTTMTQLLLGVEPKYIRLEPYVPTTAYYPPIKAHNFGLVFAKHTYLLLFPSIASYVGGDVVAGIIGANIHKSQELTLFIDLGTNGEVVVGNQDWMACAAASAGPAFEGGGIKFGMHATQGAIENFSIDPISGNSNIITVGKAKPKGICGSGLIAIVAALMLTGLIDDRGRIKLEHQSQRLREGEDGPEYVLVWANKTQIGRDITITETDIDNLMRAKSAIYAAYMTLLESVGLNVYNLDHIILAGGFGQSVSLEQAIIIGLLPELPQERFTFIGNGSLLGARLVTLSNPLRAEVIDIAEKMTNFELSNAPRYMDNYISSLFLPHTDAKNLFPKTWTKLQGIRHALRQGG